MQFQKILSYDVYGSDHESRFNRVCCLLNQTIDPDTSEPGGLSAHNKTVFISPRLRALNCLNQKTAHSITILPQLNEIPFELTKICSLADFEASGSTAVRQAFIKLFIDNQLNFNHKQLQEEFESLIEFSSRNQEALAISHTFRLRLFETYLKTDRQLFKEPTLLQKYLDPNQHWADFGSHIPLPTNGFFT